MTRFLAALGEAAIWSGAVLCTMVGALSLTRTWLVLVGFLLFAGLVYVRGRR